MLKFYKQLKLLILKNILLIFNSFKLLNINLRTKKSFTFKKYDKKKVNGKVAAHGCRFLTCARKGPHLRKMMDKLYIEIKNIISFCIFGFYLFTFKLFLSISYNFCFIMAFVLVLKYNEFTSHFHK